MVLADKIRSIPDVCDVELVRGAGADPNDPPDLLIEVPHGATTARHYEAVRNRVVGDLPDDLEAFFFVNTDVGAPECAARTARLFVAPQSDTLLTRLMGDERMRRVAALPPRQALLVRCLIPRTFIDCNRQIDIGAADFHAAGLTRAVPGYITDPRDLESLRDLHSRYQEVARSAFDRICGQGGQALVLHSYAPKSVGVDDVDSDIVRTLRRAYEPGVYESWDDRPEVDVISGSSDGGRLAPPRLVAALHGLYAEIGVHSTENVSYKLRPGSMGHVHSVRHPEQVVCMEINRALLADPYTPFQEMAIAERKVGRMAAPIAAAYLCELARVGSKLL